MPAVRHTAGAALGAALLLALTSCTSVSPSPTPADPSASASASRAKLGLPAHWDELKKWKLADWDGWAKKHLLQNPVVRDRWNPDKMKAATPQEPAPPTAAPVPVSPTVPGAPTPTATQPGPVRAVPVNRPYTAYPASGKVFTSAPDGKTGQCSATVIADPAHPGRSNLVWTAGHCVHQGKGGSWYKNIIFVPAYNSSGAASAGKHATLDQVAPLGEWWAEKAITSPQWTAEGDDHGSGAANQYDFAVLRVHNPDSPGKSLEETIGAAVPVWFDAPREKLSVSAWGYPALAPFDGQELDRCDGGHPTPLSYDAARPAMLTIGCTMTAGASGGGWFAAMPDGRQALVSNTSVGTTDHTSLSGPYLESVAKQALDYLSKQ
ncbi:hypothetical protein CFP65_5228 [Kitasatospora sp. MMS16-BH015]|uniref:trypsin-like serine peptidase n=1 Tax=Kitasatospora sp. MMS16-BH015 TaxID=2018025 RepID=UPI000CA0EB1F|nr:hypothetical protein [Kitasatospora sp. MMS16-BH015]AUG79937.1 hypothetical protein CFP65_5228 [Kitasatospora sp. MMS16-BH015]